MRHTAKPASIPFTKDGYQKVLDEIGKLEANRTEVLVRLQLAREMGDLSENGAYKAARWELSGIDRRLRELNRLKLYGEVESTTNQSGVVAFGSEVHIKNDSGQVITFTLVNEFESDPSKKRLSVNSPIGMALLGKKTGDHVTVEAPNGKQTYTILKT